MRIAIIGNGDFVPFDPKLMSYDYWIAADGGLRHCQTLGITPYCCIGDGDSLTPNEQRAYVGIMRLSADQTTTDLQKGLVVASELAQQQSYTVDLVSFTSGDRLDHTVFALQQLATNHSIASLYTPNQIISCIRQQRRWENAVGQTVSLLPVGATATVRLTGFTWSGAQIILDQARPGISNSITASPADCTIQAGAVWCFEPTLWI